MKKFIEIYKKPRNKIVAIYYRDGDAVNATVLLPSQGKCKTTDELIEKIKEILINKKISYQIYR